MTFPNFAACSDADLDSYWRLYGRDSEAPPSPRDLRLWIAVNYEKHSREEPRP